MQLVVQRNDEDLITNNILRGINKEFYFINTQ